MNLKLFVLATGFLSACTASLAAEPDIGPVSLTAPELGVIGAYYEAQGTVTGEAVILVHEWYGLDDFAHAKAQDYANAGYAVLAIDMYGDGKVTDDPKIAKQYLETAFAAPDTLDARLNAGITALEDASTIGPDHTMMIGYSFGGAVTTNAALNGFALSGFVNFYGPVPENRDTASVDITAPLLNIYAGEDAVVSSQQVGEFTTFLMDVDASFETHVFAGEKHSFANPYADGVAAEHGYPFAYSPDADADTFGLTLDFMARH